MNRAVNGRGQTSPDYGGYMGNISIAFRRYFLPSSLHISGMSPRRFALILDPQRLHLVLVIPRTISILRQHSLS